MAACYLDRAGRQDPYCKAHLHRLYRVRTGHGFDEEHWRRTDKAICTTREVSLRGMPDLLVAELLYGLWTRTQEGFKSRPECLRPLYDRLRAQQVQELREVTDPAARGHGREQVTMIRVWQRALRLLNTTPETERVKDIWDMAVFGHSGRVSFAPVLQEPLREAMKIWVYDDLPRRRNKNAVQYARAVIAAVGMFSESLRLQREDSGEVPAGWGRGDIVAFTNRMGYLTSTEQISPARRLHCTRFVRRVLLRFRTLGLTAPGQLLEGMPADCAIGPQDMPDEPEDTEAGRDLPDEVMRELCARLDELEAMSSVEGRVATELLIDTGRRPDEINTLALGCLEQDPDGSDVLIYDNHKAYRLGRRLPIGAETAAVIRRQQQRVRERFPTADPTRLRLLPRPKSNPEGTKPLSDISGHHRTWVRSLPDLLVPVLVTEEDRRIIHMVPFDKTRIFPYAYRHCYAQRHADAGVGVDVLKELMDHRLIHTTMGYYRVGDERRREAVDRVTALQFDRHGNRVWRTAKSLLDSEHVRRAIGEVATPYGVCREPTNVAAGGHACPLRFRCLGCEHFSTNVSYLPDLQAHLADLLRSRERLMSALEADDWARTQAMPSEEEIRRVRRLIDRVRTDLDDLTPEDRAQIEQAVTVVRRSRTVLLGMPRVRQPPARYPPSKDPDVTSPMKDGRQAGTERRRRRVQEAIAAAVRDGTQLTASAIARAAHVDRTFLYRHHDLLENLHPALRSGNPPPGRVAATTASLEADLANANARSARLTVRVEQLEARLSRQLGELAWQESGIGVLSDIAELQATITRLEQHAVELRHSLEHRDAELEAARAANRELTRALNQRE